MTLQFLLYLDLVWMRHAFYVRLAKWLHGQCELSMNPIVLGIHSSTIMIVHCACYHLLVSSAPLKYSV